MADDRDLAGLDALTPPPPRRTDAAFARAVASGVKERRARPLFVLPALAAATAALALVVVVHPGRSGVDAGPQVAMAPVAVPSDASADATLDDDDGPFAIPSLDGSTDEELARLDAQLDRALARRPH